VSLTCPRCNVAYSPRGGGHCMGGCHRTFTSDSGFDKHRTGSHTDNTRRCLTGHEMTEAGWRNTARGWTPFEAREFPHD